MRYLLLLLVICFMGCSSGDRAGGSDNPDFITGIAHLIDGTPVVASVVTLLPSSYDPFVHDTTTVFIDTTDGEGRYSFSDVDAREYTLSVYDTLLEIGGLTGGVMPTTKDGLDENIIIDSLGKLAIFLSDTIRIDTVHVSILGTEVSQTLIESVPYENSLQRVLVSGVPVGAIDELRTYVTPTSYVAFENTVVTSTDTASLLYDDSNLEELRPLWDFPIIVGVPDTMVHHFGGTTALRTLIEDHLFRTTQSFQVPDFEGYITFTLDSLYVIPGTIDAENITPPAEFALRLLYDPFNTSTIGNWVKNNRVMVQNYPENSVDGTFGDGSLVSMAWVFGLARGANYIVQEEVYDINNPISGESYLLEPTVMALMSATDWLPYNTHIINQTTNSWSWEHDSLANVSAETLSFLVTDSFAEALDGVTIEQYGVVPYSLSVKDSLLRTSTTSIDGVALVAGYPYLKPDKSGLEYSNMLLKLTYNAQVKYVWLPHSEVSHFVRIHGNPTIFHKAIVF